MGDEDKQFEATPQKLQRARKEGQVVKSKDFSTALSLIAMCFTIYKLSPFIWDQITKLFVLMYEQIPNRSIEEVGFAYIGFLTVFPTVLIIGPILLMAWFVAVMADLIQIGPLFATAPLVPKLDKLNPTKYFKNLISVKTFFELFKNIFKVLILGFTGYFVYSAHLPSILQLIAIDNSFAVMLEFGSLIVDFVTKAGIIFLVIAGADYGVTRWKFLKDQKMSFKEIKDEYKNTEGDPHVKAALRQKRQQMLAQGSANSVIEADCVITNPQHVAVAIKYDEAEMEAPIVLTKGEDMMAEKIKKLAHEHGVIVTPNAPLARALYQSVDANQQVPAELYQAVAEILLFVYELRKQ